MNLYPYASGNLLKNRNTYFYTKYKGIKFLNSWQKDRERILKNLPDKKALPIQPILFSSKEWSQKLVDGKIIKTRVLLNDLLNEIYSKKKTTPDLISWLDRLVKRFEVFKRVHEAYNSNFKATEKGNYNNLKLYIMLCALFDLAYLKTKDLTYLNVMLKCLDTLCAMHNQLDDEEKSYLAQLIKNEKRHIEKISKNIELVL